MLRRMLDEAIPEASLPHAPPCIPSGLRDTSTEDDGRAGPVAEGNRRVDEEVDLVGRARRGDRDAFGELFRLHHGRLYRFARAHVGEAADDVVAETFLRAWRALAVTAPRGLRSPRGCTGSPGTWWPTSSAGGTA